MAEPVSQKELGSLDKRFFSGTLLSIHCRAFPSLSTPDLLHHDPVHSSKGLKQQYFLINAEPVQDHHEILPAARDLALHGQAEIFLHSFCYAPGNCVVP